uniref:Uncharacterized protein LOC111126779 n=1 Tax=Crassostrea virginica TaxID=6565 RepID=A0A8B8DI18_CRAVI|nr:uncharacterized protein LOC111126779 [Crassostrea virginica]
MDDNSHCCDSHPGHECSVFCKTCDLPICRLCVSNEHKSHNLSELSEKIEEVSKSIAQENDRLKTLLDRTTKQLSSLTEFYKKANEDVSVREKDWLKQIEKFTKKLHQEMDDLKKEKGAKLQKQKGELEEMIGKIEEMNRKSATLKESKKLKEMMKFRSVISEQKMLKEYNNEFKIDENDLQTNFECTERLKEIKVSLVGKDYMLDDDSTEKILEVLFVSSALDTEAQIQKFLKGQIEEKKEGLMKRFLKKEIVISVFFILSMFSLFSLCCFFSHSEIATYFLDPLMGTGFEKNIPMVEQKFISDPDLGTKVLEVPSLSSVIDTRFPADMEYHSRLFDMALTDDRKVWVGGYNKVLKLFDLQGHLHRTVPITFTGLYICMYNKQVVFIHQNDKSVNKISDDDTVMTMFTTGDWRPYGITGSASGDLLVCLRKDDQSKVVRFNSNGTVLQEIQNDSESQPLYQHAWYIAENFNGDIIVTDVKKNILVAVDKQGMFLYTYPLRNDDFDVCSVATDSVGHVYVSDYKGHKIHMLDSKGRFLRYIIPEGGINYPRPICMIGDGEMIVGECLTGLAKRIKLLE